MKKKVTAFIIFFCLVAIASCLQSPKYRRTTGILPDPNEDLPIDATADTEENSATEKIIAKSIPFVEIKHLVDPVKGSHSAKVTIPKNFGGYLYLSGINFSSLSDRLVSVRFKFGRELSAVTVPATLGLAEGLTPQTNIQVLIMDFGQKKYFENIRLLYDLYDYNSYSGLSSPVNNPYDVNLYCRGLNLEHDPTFESDQTKCDGVTACSYHLQECDHPKDKCYYAFAKIKDNGLYNSEGYASIPTEPQVDISGSDFVSTETNTTIVSSRNAINLKKCLPDNGVVYYRHVDSNYRLMTFDKNEIIAGIGDSVMSILLDGTIQHYSYKGPYRPLSKKSWVLKTTGVVGPRGIFEKTFGGDSTKIEEGIYSYLFPRSGKLNLNENISHLSSTLAQVVEGSVRSINSLLSPGQTHWMDGCNLRMSNYDHTTNEHIGSCNVTALIEVITKDPETKSEYVINSTYKVKLQLIRASIQNFEGDETLYQSMKSCSSGRTCGKNECCFNRRCWSKELVSQCAEDAIIEGNYLVGESCTSDYQCTGLCCNRALGRCAVHNDSLNPAVYCSKSPGDYCVAKEWCRRDSTRLCLLVITGVSPTGARSCAIRCYNKLEFGDCVNGVCVAPVSPPPPSYDPANPNCEGAVYPPTSL